MSFDRRTFLQTSLLFGAAGLGFFPKQRVEARDFISNEFYSSGPIQELTSFKGSTEFTGEQENEGHEIFWDKEGFLKRHGPIPPSSKTYDVIVIGGGMAGLSSAYFHRNHNTLLLDGHPQMGGNSRAETFQNLSMSCGAAYINIPELNDPLDSFLKELGLSQWFRKEGMEDISIGVNGKFIPDFWNQGEDFRRVHAKFMDVYQNDYPGLPVYPGTVNREKLNAFDKLTFAQWVQTNLGEVHPLVSEFFHQYCWSSFGGSPEELSAAQVVGFISSDMNGVQSQPGGNAVVADAVYKKLKNSKVRMQNNSFAVNIKSLGSGAEVTYLEDQKRLVTVKARKVIVATSKQVAKNLVQDLDESQYAAMKALSYRAYLLGNVLLDRKVSSPGYDIFALKGRVPVSARRETEDRGFCDIVFADWANHDRADQTALSLYMPQPFEGANQFLFSPQAYEKHRIRLMNNLTPWLSAINLTPANVLGIRMSRYGHGIPLARHGMIASGVLEKAHKTIDNSIFFAHSDNWANPCLETAFYSAMSAI